MRQETNNEMDLLLRRLGRRHEEPASNGDGHLNHLDADELSAYAENALPAAARARYTEHLAECTRCRELVVSLSGAAGVVVAQETVKVPASSGLRKFLASLFSPMVLRYAGPAVGLILIAVIGLIVLRRPEETTTDFVVQVPKEQTAPSPASSAPAASAPVFSYSTDQDSASAANKEPNKVAPVSTPAPVVAPNAPPVVDSVTAEDRQEAAAGAAAQPFAKEDRATPKPADAISENKVKAEAEGKKDSGAGGTGTGNQAPPSVEKTVEQAEISSRQIAALPATRSEARGLTAGVQSSRAKVQRDGTDDKNSNYSAETRSVAGRRFRKEGSVWIDTDYNSSRSAMTLARGSEQFRALIADEPQIKTIADQLDGEIIVIWKGRVYRIR